MAVLCWQWIHKATTILILVGFQWLLQVIWPYFKQWKSFEPTSASDSPCKMVRNSQWRYSRCLAEITPWLSKCCNLVHSFEKLAFWMLNVLTLQFTMEVLRLSSRNNFMAESQMLQLGPFLWKISPLDAKCFDSATHLLARLWLARYSASGDAFLCLAKHQRFFDGGRWWDSWQTPLAWSVWKPSWSTQASLPHQQTVHLARDSRVILCWDCCGGAT